MVSLASAIFFRDENPDQSNKFFRDNEDLKTSEMFL